MRLDPACRLTGHEACVVRGTFNTHDKLATASADTSVKIWDLAEGRLISTLGGSHTQSLTDCAWHGSGNWLVTACEGGALYLWDTRTGTSVGSAKCDDPTYCVSLGKSPNSCSLATGDSRGVLSLWDVRQFASLSSHYPSDQNKPHIEAIASHSPLSSVQHAQDDSVIVTAGLDGNIRLWSSWSVDCLRTLGAGASGTECMGATIASSDIRDKSVPVYIAGLYSDGLARVWDLRSHRSMRWLHGVEQPGVKSVANEFAASSRSQSVQGSPESTSTKAPSTSDGEKIKNFCRPCISILGREQSSDSPVMYMPGLDRRVYAVVLKSGRAVGKSPVGHTCPISSISCNSTGEVLVSTGYGRDASAMVWHVREGGVSMDGDVEELPEEAFHEVPPQIAGLKVL